MVKNLFIGVLLLTILAMGSALIRVENQRYALSTGMCPGPAPGLPPDLTCMSKVETRTGWWWHLYYALTDQTNG